MWKDPFSGGSGQSLFTPRNGSAFRDRANLLDHLRATFAPTSPVPYDELFGVCERQSYW